MRLLSTIAFVLLASIAACADREEAPPPEAPPPPPAYAPPEITAPAPPTGVTQTTSAEPAPSATEAPKPAPAPSASSAEGPLPPLPSQAPRYEPTGDQPPPEVHWVQSYPSGRWVYVVDRGWVWVPANTTATDYDGVPYVYLYTPRYGWTWYVSPWGWGAYSYGVWVARPWYRHHWHGGWVARPPVVRHFGHGGGHRR